MDTEIFTKRELQTVYNVRELYQKIETPGYRAFFKLLEANYFHNYPLTIDDAKQETYNNVLCYCPQYNIEGTRPKTIFRVRNMHNNI